MAIIFKESDSSVIAIAMMPVYFLYAENYYVGNDHSCSD